MVYTKRIDIWRCISSRDNWKAVFEVSKRAFRKRKWTLKLIARILFRTNCLGLGGIYRIPTHRIPIYWSDFAKITPSYEGFTTASADF